MKKLDVYKIMLLWLILDGDDMLISLRKPFDEVWKDIQATLSNRDCVETLVQRIKNKIISVEKDHIKLKSEKTGKIRKVSRSQFEHVWNTLAVNGYYISRDHQPYIHSQIICAILFLLNYIEVRHNPLTIYLKEHLTL